MLNLNGRQYKLIFLDTHVLGEIVSNKQKCGYNFLKKYFNRNQYFCPCFSIYNVIELKPREKAYQNFIQFFNSIPCLITLAYKNIISEEYLAYKENRQIDYRKVSIAILPGNIEKIMDLFFSSQNYKQFIHELKEMEHVAEIWTSQRNQDYGDIRIGSNEIYKKYELITIVKDLVNYGIKDYFPKIEFLPGVRIIAYSQYCRVHTMGRKITINDVMDVQISCIVPYIDIVIVEAQQYDVYMKAKKFINQMEYLEVYKLSYLRD